LLGKDELFKVFGDSDDDELPDGVEPLECTYASLCRNSINGAGIRAEYNTPDSCLMSRQAPWTLLRHHHLTYLSSHLYHSPTNSVVSYPSALPAILLIVPPFPIKKRKEKRRKDKQGARPMSVSKKMVCSRLFKAPSLTVSQISLSLSRHPETLTVCSRLFTVPLLTFSPAYLSLSRHTHEMLTVCSRLFMVPSLTFSPVYPSPSSHP
jgi:hypothetical protein